MIASRIAAIATIIGALLTAGSGTSDAYGPWSCAPGNPWQPTAELFGTWNTATITDPADPRMDDPLTQFELEVELTAVMEAGLPVSSEPIDGVHWSEQSQQITYEPPAASSSPAPAATTCAGSLTTSGCATTSKPSSASNTCPPTTSEPTGSSSASRAST
ncbi:hypothetical protein [Nocardia amikacinitolerans]|uniref:hypothetical protein n=1 Tax=Nocardia amikacinitolerans TaxID=756689 RepID=UPI0020A59314|nr:hypothetical protein [Nocardia amikacinitolerans]